MAAHSDSHVYVDIWRRVGSGPFQSLSRLLGGNGADGLMSEHSQGRLGAPYEQGKWPMVMDEPNVAAGTRLEYKVYVGLWSGSTVTFGSHRNGEILPPLPIRVSCVLRMLWTLVVHLPIADCLAPSLPCSFGGDGRCWEQHRRQQQRAFPGTLHHRGDCGWKLQCGRQRRDVRQPHSPAARQPRANSIQLAESQL